MTRRRWRRRGAAAAGAEPPVRPRAGTITWPSGGPALAVRFVPTADPARFLAVTADGDRIDGADVLRRGGSMQIDVLGPGQQVVFSPPLPGPG